MRILFFNYEFPPLGGGGANANAYLFREFSRLGVHVDCVTSAVGNDDETVELYPHIVLHRLAIGKKELHFWTQREILVYLRRAHSMAGRLLGEHQYDLCHAFFGFPSGMLAWLKAKKLPYLISLRGSDVPGFNPRFSLQYVALKPLFRRIWGAAEYAVVNSVGLRDLAQQFEPELDYGIIPNGIDTEEFLPGAETERRDSHILCVSRLVGRKGVQYLIQAMPEILKYRPNAFLTIVGEGNLVSELRDQGRNLHIDDRINFKGYVPHDALPQIYRSAQLFVQPSFYEGMSNTVLEAMACGLPIVATGNGGKEELFHGNALTASYGNSKSLADALVHLLADHSARKRMGLRSRDIAESFSWRAVALQYQELYCRMMKR